MPLRTISLPVRRLGNCGILLLLAASLLWLGILQILVIVWYPQVLGMGIFWLFSITNFRKKKGFRQDPPPNILQLRARIAHLVWLLIYWFTWTSSPIFRSWASIYLNGLSSWEERDNESEPVAFPSGYLTTLLTWTSSAFKWDLILQFLRRQDSWSSETTLLRCFSQFLVSLHRQSQHDQHCKWLLSMDASLDSHEELIFFFSGSEQRNFFCKSLTCSTGAVHWWVLGKQVLHEGHVEASRVFVLNRGGGWRQQTDQRWLDDWWVRKCVSSNSGECVIPDFCRIRKFWLQWKAQTKIEAESTLDARRKRKQMEPAVANGSVHTGCKQHQRNCPQNCVLASSVDWAHLRRADIKAIDKGGKSKWRQWAYFIPFPQHPDGPLTQRHNTSLRRRTPDPSRASSFLKASTTPRSSKK